MTQLDSDLKAANKAADILIAEALRLREQRDELLAFAELVVGVFQTAEVRGLHLDRDKKYLLEQAGIVISKAKA